MPAKTEKQRRFMGAELQRQARGQEDPDGNVGEGAREDGQQEEELGHWPRTIGRNLTVWLRGAFEHMSGWARTLAMRGPT